MKALVSLATALALVAAPGLVRAQDKATTDAATKAGSAAAKKAAPKDAAAAKSTAAGKQVVPTAAGESTQGSMDRGGGKHCHDKASDA